MLSTYGIHPAHDVACAGHDLRHAIRALTNDETLPPDVVGLGTVTAMADVIADALDRYWHYLRPLVEDHEES